MTADRTRFTTPVDAALRAMRLAARTLGHQTGRILGRRPAHPRIPRFYHRHTVFPAAVEAWAEFGGLHLTPQGPGRQIAPAQPHLDPLHGLHMARTLGDLGRALDTEVCPLGAESGSEALLAIDTEGRVYALDHSGDWYLGPDIDHALETLVNGTQPTRLTAA